MITKVKNKFGIEINIGDKLLIVSDNLNGKKLANVQINDVIVVSGFSDNKKILYHHNTLALPVDCDIYEKL